MKYFTFFLLIIFIISCGPSKEEIILREKIKQDSINAVIEKVKQEAKEKAEQEIKKQVSEAIKAEKKKNIDEQENDNNVANNFLEYKLEWDFRVFKDKRLSVKIHNKDKYRLIKNVKFKVLCYSKTMVYLGAYQDVIFDYIKPDEWYARNIGLDKFPNQTEKYSVKIIDSEFQK